MVRVLLVEDNIHKAKKIEELFLKENNQKVTIENSLIGAKAILEREKFDLLILDIQLPIRKGGRIIESGGLQLLEELKEDERMKVPTHIVGMTQYENIYDTYKIDFDKSLISFIKFCDADKSWENKLKEKYKLIKKDMKEIEENPRKILEKKVENHTYFKYCMIGLVVLSFLIYILGKIRFSIVIMSLVLMIALISTINLKKEGKISESAFRDNFDKIFRGLNTFKKD